MRLKDLARIPKEVGKVHHVALRLCREAATPWVQDRELAAGLEHEVAQEVVAVHEAGLVHLARELTCGHQRLFALRLGGRFHGEHGLEVHATCHLAGCQELHRRLAEATALDPRKQGVGGGHTALGEL